MTLTEANKPQTSKNSVLASGFQLFSTRHWLVNKLNLTKLVSVFLQRRQTQTLFSQCLCGSIMSLGTWCSAPLQIYICIKKKVCLLFTVWPLNRQLNMLLCWKKYLTDKTAFSESAHQFSCEICRTKHELPNKIMHKFVQHCKAITFH